MAEQDAALNTSGDSPAPDIPADGDTVSTMITPKSGADSSESGRSDADGKDAKEDVSGKAEGAKDAKDDEGDRFDKHPRFIELNNRMKAAETTAAQAEARAANLSREIAELKTQAPTESEALPYKDISKMSDDDLRDWIDTNPQEYTNNLVAMLRHELKTDVSTDLETDRMDRMVENTFSSFAKENPEFDKMWDSGELKQYMDANPGHNAISAFMVLTREAAISAAKEEQEKETTEKLRKDFETKRSSQVLGDGPGSAGRPNMDENADLEDTASSGGLIATLTKRSMARTTAR